MNIYRLFITVCMDAIDFIRPAIGPIGVCRFVPSCTAFAREQLLSQSLHRALWAITKRILACNPLVKNV